MDILKDNFQNSIFKNFSQNFWNPNTSWRNKYIDGDKSKGRKYPSYLSGIFDTFSDGWHIAKFIMIIGICVGMSLQNSITLEEFVKNFLINLGIWGLTFKLFYSKLLIKK